MREQALSIVDLDGLLATAEFCEQALGRELHGRVTRSGPNLSDEAPVRRPEEPPPMPAVTGKVGCSKAIMAGHFAFLKSVASKAPELESRNFLKKRIDEASKFVALENLCLSPQCGFSSTHHGNKLSIDQQWRKLERVVEVAREVWG